MRLSIILADCSYREMFHTPIYLNRQNNVNRKDYEIIWMELYDKENPILKEYKEKGILDKYIIMRRPRTRYVQLPLLYNEAILQSNGDILCIMDGDAICSPNFVSSIISSFEQFEKIILYMDEFRHAPNKWCWPVVKEWDEIIQIRDTYSWDNWGNVRTTDVNDLAVTRPTPFFDIYTAYKGMESRNYGACFSVLRKDIIKIGGFEEYEGYEGSFNGPFEAGWRLLPLGFREYWHPKEFILHSFHMGSDGYNSANIAPPRPEGYIYMNSYATRRLMGLPWIENEKIRDLRKQQN